MELVVHVLEQQNDLQRQGFHALATAVHDGHATPPDPAKVEGEIFRASFRDRSRSLLVRRNDRPVARAVAHLSPGLTSDDGAPLGMIGYFEAEEDSEAVEKVLAEAISWLKQQGATEIIGPMNGDTWHKYRFNIGPYTPAPFLMEPWNPPWYSALWETNGFVALEDYYSQHIDDAAAYCEHMEKFNRRALRAGYTFRPIDLNRFEDELNILHRISIEIFSDNFLYTGITPQDFAALYLDAKGILDPELILFALSPEGEEVGFVFALPDLGAAVDAMKGKRHLWAKLKFLLASRQVKTFNVKSLGVVAEHRRAGLAAALFYQAYAPAIKKGYRHANHCLIKEGNASGRFEKGYGRLLRKYRLYRFGGAHV